MPSAQLHLIDRTLALAEQGLSEGGLPIGSILVRNGAIIGEGYNRRVQQGDPIAHGEMDCLRGAGRQRTYRDTILYTSLSPCMMCAGTIVQFGIPRLVILENENFGGNEDFLRACGVEIELVQDPRAIAMMKGFIAANPALWHEDIAED